MRPSKFRILIFVISFLGALHGCATVPQKVTVAQRDYLLKDLCEQYHIQWQWDSISQIVTLYFDGREAKALIGSEVVLLDNQQITLSSPIRTLRSSVIVPGDFRRKVIKRMVAQPREKEAVTIKKIKTIIIDAGHGGKDPGAIGRTNEYEKDVVLDITKRLKRILQRNGFHVKMTRNTDQFVSLQKRTEISSKQNTDFFISIHANSNPVRAVHGLEVYTLKDLTWSEKNEEQRLKNHRLKYRTLSMKANDVVLGDIISDMMYSHKQAQSQELALLLSEKTARIIRTKNLGVKVSRFFVLRNTLIPAVLVEVGFLSNPQEEKKLKSKVYRQKIAFGLAESITAYAYGR